MHRAAVHPGDLFDIDTTPAGHPAEPAEQASAAAESETRSARGRPMPPI